MALQDHVGAHARGHREALGDQTGAELRDDADRKRCAAWP
jgi:hypothetical protein